MKYIFILFALLRFDSALGQQQIQPTSGSPSPNSLSKHFIPSVRRMKGLFTDTGMMFPQKTRVHEIENPAWIARQDGSGTTWNEERTLVEFQYNGYGKVLTELDMYWDSVAATIDTGGVIKYSYDENDSLVQVIYQPDIHDSISMWRDLYSYDANHNLTDLMEQQWDNENKKWYNQANYPRAYDENNNLTSITYQIWFTNNTNGWWHSDTRSVYAYDSSNREIQHIDQFWQGPKNGWINSANYLFRYDKDNNMVEEIYQLWKNYDSIWLNSGATDFTYDSLKNVITELDKNWSNADDSFDYGYLRTFSYNSFNELTVYLYQGWSVADSIWKDGDKFVYTYDENGNLLTYLQLNSYTGSGDWTNYLRTVFTNDASGNPLVQVEQFWDNGPDWDNFEKWTYGYTAFTSIPFVKPNVVNVKTYPNPFSQSFTISYTLKETANVTINLSDITGKLITVIYNQQESTGGHIVKYSNAELPDGIYLYTIRAGNKIFNGKLIKEQ